MSHFQIVGHASAILLAIVHAVGLLFVPPEPKEKPVEVEKAPVIVEGYYEIDGEIDGRPYTGLAIITKQAAGYAVHWVSTDHVGAGTVDGMQFIVGFGSAGGMRGVAVFEIGEKTLTGWWVSLPGTGRRQKETMTFLKALRKEKP